MLRPTDASLIGLYPVSSQTQVSDVCDGKTKLFLTRALLLTAQNSSHCSEIQEKRTAEFFLEEEQLIYGFGRTYQARLHPKLNYVLTFEMTL